MLPLFTDIMLSYASQLLVIASYLKTQTLVAWIDLLLGQYVWKQMSALKCKAITLKTQSKMF